MLKAWIVPAGSAGPATLRLVDRPAPEPGPGQVRVRMKAWSTNFRDLAVAGGFYAGGPVGRDTIALSDGAGEITSVGDGVQQWKAGDRVAPIFFQKWLDGPFGAHVPGSDLGGSIDGVLAEEVVLDQQGLVRIPDQLSFEEAACLPCAGVTAWHAIARVGFAGPGQTVLLLGTGGVSVFALQFAKARGATVIMTSSSDDKLARAAALGADHGINYRTHPQWDARVMELTQGRGVDLVVEVGGPGTLQQSLNAVAAGGSVALIGVLADPMATVSPLPLIGKSARLQGLYVGSKAMFEELNRAVTDAGIHPVIDRRFGFDDVPAAYAYQASAGHFGKIVIA